MSSSVRPLFASGLTLLTAGVVAVAPVAVMASSPDHPALPTVHVENVQLAGIGQDIYNAVTPYVQYAVGGVSYIVNFLPIIGAPIAAQININYFQGIQPIVAATVNYLAGVVQNPLNFFATTAAYGTALFDIAYNWVSAEAVWIGLPPLLPLPSAAAVAPRTAARATAATGRRPGSAAARPARAAAVASRETVVAAKAPRAAAGQARKAAKPTRAVVARG